MKDKEIEEKRDPLVCPRCESCLTFVDGIRELPSGRIRELRVCYHCKKRFSIIRGGEEAPEERVEVTSESGEKQASDIKVEKTDYKLF
jgi:transcriptional regulator NrdR family protein